jgi:hypothetical protein
MTLQEPLAPNEAASLSKRFRLGLWQFQEARHSPDFLLEFFGCCSDLMESFEQT